MSGMRIFSSHMFKFNTSQLTPRIGQSVRRSNPLIFLHELGYNPLPENPDEWHECCKG
jgi:hypothetical protein